jgi:CHAD domain-containing protein
MARAAPLPRTSGDEPVGDVARTTLRTRGDELLGLDGRLDPRRVHDLRVAARRLRALLEVFADALPGKRTRRARRAAKVVARALGVVRDLDVARTSLRPLLRAAGPAERPGLAALDAAWRADRSRAATAARSVLDEGLPALAAALDDLLAAPARDARPARDALGPLVAERRATLDALLPAARDPGDPAAVHAARVAAKRLRYVLEALPDLGAREEPALRRLQDELGAIHDADVHLDAVAAFAHALDAADLEAARARPDAPAAVTDLPGAALRPGLAAAATWVRLRRARRQA